jgi:hypothetical protein
MAGNQKREFWAVFVAALIVWRRPDSDEAQLLALVLILGNLGTAIAPLVNDWVTPWPALVNDSPPPSCSSSSLERRSHLPKRHVRT